MIFAEYYVKEILDLSCQFGTLTIGLFGQVGAGKSTLANRFLMVRSVFSNTVHLQP